MPRYCFRLQVRPEMVAEYARRHRAVWPQMLVALQAAGWHNYSLFLDPDGLLIGYVEADSLRRAQSAMSSTDINTRWQAEMSPFFEELGGGRPDTELVLLSEVFHLQDQLDASSQS